MRSLPALLLPALVVLGTLPVPGLGADLFDRHTSEHLRTALDDGLPIAALSMPDTARLGSLDRNIGGPILVVRTNDGNLAKVVVAWGFRRNGEKLVPVVVLERSVTYRSDRRDVTAARDENVMLFAGLSYNLDIGQVVPDGQGGDLQLTADGHLVPIGEAVVVALEKSQIPPATDSDGRPDDHDGVLPRDFTGTWSVDVDGRWHGELVLGFDAAGRLSGRYTSSDSKSSYDVTGRIAAIPHNVKLDFQLDNVRQEVDAYLWTKDKSRLAGTATLAGRPFGFLAARVNAEEHAAEPSGSEQ